MQKQHLEQYYLDRDYNCAESVLRGANDEFDLQIPEEGLKLVGAYGGGFGCGITCGALCGAMAAISAARIHERAHEDPAFKDVCSGFVARFEEKMGSLQCKELKKRFQKEGKRCFAVVEQTAELLEEYLKELEQGKEE